LSTTRKRTNGQRLRQERERLHWSQEQLAEKIGTTALSINRWEHDKAVPRLFYQAELCRVFNIRAQDLFDDDQDTQEETSDLPVIWNIPHLRNLYFTGREAILVYLHEALSTKKTVALTQPQAISGLGGIGKTQTAVEYAYRYGAEYSAVLWARADFHRSLISDFVAIAALLNLPEHREVDQQRVVEAVKRWLQAHRHWLLILDNADDVEMVSDFLPTRGGGHILLTSRSQATGPSIKGIEVEKMEREEGALLLLRRAKLLAEDASLEYASAKDHREAEAITEMLDGLPLALDQAAAYIEEHKCSLADYLLLYQSRRTALLQRRGTLSKRDYPKSVATTWSLSFEQVERTDPFAADVLRLCSFLHPDAIAEAIILEGAIALDPILQPIVDDPIRLDEVIGELRKYSLVRRNPETRTLTLHRLVQTVLKDAMDKETQQAWAERTVKLVNHVFPEPEFSQWETSQLYLPHAQICAELIERWDMAFPEAARLLHRTGDYLYKRERYQEVEPFYQRAQTIYEQVLGPVHPDVARMLHYLALLNNEFGKYEQVGLLLQQALAIYEQVLEPTHPDVASTLNDLAAWYGTLGKYDQAMPLMQRVLTIREQVLEPNYPDIATSFNTLGVIYAYQGKYEQAEVYLGRSLAIREQVLGPNHPDVADCLVNLSIPYRNHGKYHQAEVLLQRALSIFGQELGNRPMEATTLNHLAKLYCRWGKYEQAEPLYLRALSIYEQILGPGHPHVGACLNGLGSVYSAQGRYEQAEPILQRALTIREKTLGPDHPSVAEVLHNLATLYYLQDKYTDAEPFYQRAVIIREQSLGPGHPDLATTLAGYAKLLRRTGREDNAAALEGRAKTT
jgi:tetratricopeptide (TPR) repeat protein/transcriptional regulator with XRE-family HTH domain